MRSKPDPVDQPERTAHYDCAMCIAEMLHRDSSVNIALPPDQHHCSDEATWRLEGHNRNSNGICMLCSTTSRGYTLTNKDGTMTIREMNLVDWDGKSEDVGGVLGL